MLSFFFFFNYNITPSWNILYRDVLYTKEQVNETHQSLVLGVLVNCEDVPKFNSGHDQEKKLSSGYSVQSWSLRFGL